MSIPSEVIDDIMEISRGLLEKSLSRMVRWEKAGEPRDENYVVHLPDYSVNVRRTRDRDADPGVQMRVLDGDGIEIINFVVWSYGSDAEVYSELMDPLLVAAKRRALNLDSALNALRQVVGQEGPIGGFDRDAEDDS